MNDRLAYTVAEACEALRIGRTKLYALLADGAVKGVKLGGKTLILRDSLEGFAAGLPAMPARQALEASDGPLAAAASLRQGRDR